MEPKTPKTRLEKTPRPFAGLLRSGVIAGVSACVIFIIISGFFRGLSQTVLLQGLGLGVVTLLLTLVIGAFVGAMIRGR